MQTLKDDFTMAQNRMKQQANQHRTKREFELVDWVFVRLQPYKQLSLKEQGKNKIEPKFYDPYQIIWNISNISYELKLPETSRIHNVFHVSNLKKLLGQQQSVQTTLPTLDEEGKLILEPEAIIKIREWRLHTRMIKEYLIKWNNFLEEDGSWETEKFVQ